MRCALSIDPLHLDTATPMDSTHPLTDLQELAARLRIFARQRDWEQYHTPKNLAAALSVEAAELLEHFQWKTPEQSMDLGMSELQEVAHEMADVFIYLVRMADCLDIDLMAAATEKMELNRSKYPPLMHAQPEHPDGS